MTRADAIARARQQLHSGAFLAELDRRVAFQTESQNPERGDVLRAYLEQDLQPAFSKLDFKTRLIESPSGIIFTGTPLSSSACRSSKLSGTGTRLSRSPC